MKNKGFLRPTIWKIILTIFLTFVILIFLKLYPVDTVGCGWTSECHNYLTFHSLFSVIKNGFDWSPRIVDASINYIANPIYLILYFLYIFLTYIVASFIMFLYKIKFLIISKSRIIISLLALLSFAPLITRLSGFRVGDFIYTLGEFIGGISFPFYFLHGFLFWITNIFLKFLDFGLDPFSKLSIFLNINQGIVKGNLLLGFIIVIILWYFVACLFVFSYNKIKKFESKKLSANGIIVSIIGLLIIILNYMNLEFFIYGQYGDKRVSYGIYIVGILTIIFGLYLLINKLKKK